MLQGNKLLHHLAKSKLLEEPGIAEQFLATVSRLLEFAFSIGNHDASEAENQGTYSFLCKNIGYDAIVLLLSLHPHPPSGHLPPLCKLTLSSVSNSQLVSCWRGNICNICSIASWAAGAIGGLWPLAEGTFITQLLSNGGSSATAVAEVASLYHLLLEGLPQLTGAEQQGSSIVNALAFGCRIQQSLWR